MSKQRYERMKLIACAIVLPAIAIAALNNNLRATMPSGLNAMIDFAVFGPVAATWKLIAG